MTKEQRARKMREYRGLGMSYDKIAALLGTHKEAVMKELVPGYLERSRANSLRWKHRNRKKCARCGKQIWRTSIHCHECSGIVKTKWTKEAVIDAIQHFNAENGRPPYSAEWLKSNPEKGYPSYSRVYGPRTPFPSWNAAISAAGFTPTPPGHRRH